MRYFSLKATQNTLDQEKALIDHLGREPLMIERFHSLPEPTLDAQSVRIVLVLSGIVQIKVGDRWIAVDADNYAVLNAGDPLESTSVSGHYRTLVVHWPDHHPLDRRNPLSPTFRFLPELRPMEQAMVNWLEQLRRSASICQQTAASHDGAAHRMIESMMLREEKRLRGLHQKARLTNGALSSERQAVQLLRARERIETGYHEPLSLDDLAAVACLSRFHFLRLFAERFGTTPAQYMALKRLKSALRLMANADLSIDEIARQVGYRSRTTLYRQIVSKLGQPPARVRADAGRHLRTLIAK